MGLTPRVVWTDRPTTPPPWPDPHLGPLDFFLPACLARSPLNRKASFARGPYSINNINIIINIIIILIIIIINSSSSSSSFSLLLICLLRLLLVLDSSSSYKSQRFNSQCLRRLFETRTQINRKRWHSTNRDVLAPRSPHPHLPFLALEDSLTF